METRVTIRVEARAQGRLYVLLHLDAGRLTAEEAARILGPSVRQVRRLLATFRGEGLAGLVHGNAGRTPGHRTPDDLRDRLVGLAHTTSEGVNRAHLAELLTEREGSRSRGRRRPAQRGREMRDAAASRLAGRVRSARVRVGHDPRGIGTSGALRREQSSSTLLDMRYKVIALLVVAFAVAIIGADAVIPGTPVHLLTSDGNDCYLNFVEGDLSTDPVAGTAISDGGHRMVVMWPAGYTGQQSLLGSITVFNNWGQPVAKTGTHIHLNGAQLNHTEDVWLGCLMVEL